MKALTLWQPWASLIALGHKKVETRCWSTKYRGPIAIHSALKKPDWLGVSLQTPEFVRELVDLKVKLETLPCGAILCTAELVGIEQTHLVIEDLSRRELIFGNYEPGRFAWFLENVRALDEPIPVKGNRLLWNWDESGL